MNLYKVTADLEGYGLTAVVACDKAGDAIDLSGFDGGSYDNQEVTWIGDSVYTEPTCVCVESL